MHMMSKKDISSSDMETRRSRISTTVVTASGEVQTNEEAQVYVHALDLFVTVQIPDDTRGCSIAWKTLRRPRIFVRVGQRSKTKVDRRGEGHFFAKRTTSYPPCCSRVIHQFWEQFVVNIDIAGFVCNKFSPRSKQSTAIHVSGPVVRSHI